MNNCECGAKAELFDLTTATGHIQYQVVCANKCGRETVICGGESALQYVADAWNCGKVTILYTVAYRDEKVAESYRNTFSNFDLKVAARFACFLLQNNVSLDSITRITPYGKTTTLWGYEKPEDYERDTNHDYEWLAITAGVELKLCSCHEVIQQNTDRCASSICRG